MIREIDFFTERIVMKLSEHFAKNQNAMSFEVFPPKTDSSMETVTHATEAMALLHPAFMSVTYGAGGGTSQYTLDIARHIEKDYGVHTIAHLTCVSSTRDTVRQRIRELKEAGIDNVMALRGDLLPHQIGSDRSDWHFRHAVDLIHELKSQGDFCIGGACYPEVHPESANQQEDILHLKEKVDAGCSFLTTQMFFDNQLLYNFLYKIREAGITVPVVAGIMPITNAKQIDRAIKLSGSFIPQRLLTLADAFGADPFAMKQAGIAYAIDQIVDLYAHGIKNIHVYSMNKPEVAAQIQSSVSEILGK